jgi:hypothetical protein
MAPMASLAAASAPVLVVELQQAEALPAAVWRVKVWLALALHFRHQSHHLNLALLLQLALAC